ncbi:MAG: alpha/beta hydrolase [Myxococcota bacterium]
MTTIAVSTVAGPLDVHRSGAPDGPAVVYVHGALVDAEIWRSTADLLPGTNNVRVDLPLGCHRTATHADARLHPRAMAALVAEVIEQLDLHDVTLVGNDSGGAICQLVAGRHPERLAGLVLTNCDALETFPPPGFGYLRGLSYTPRLARWVAKVFAAMPWLGRLPLTWGSLATGLPASLLRRWTRAAASPHGMPDVGKFFREAKPAVTLAAAEGLARFERPIRFVWGDADRFFPISLARRLAERCPDATVTTVAGARTYVMLDAPEAVAEEISASVRSHRASLPTSPTL